MKRNLYITEFRIKCKNFIISTIIKHKCLFPAKFHTVFPDTRMSIYPNEVFFPKKSPPPFVLKIVNFQFSIYYYEKCLTNINSIFPSYQVILWKNSSFTRKKKVCKHCSAIVDVFAIVYAIAYFAKSTTVIPYSIN